MSTQHFTVTHPDGTVSKRQSKSRDYTHAVVISPATQDARRAALNAQADALLAQADRWNAAADAGDVLVTYRGMGIAASEYHSHEARLRGTEVTGGRHRYAAVRGRCNDALRNRTWARYVPAGVTYTETGETDYQDDPVVTTDIREHLIAQARAEAVDFRTEAASLREQGETPDAYPYTVIRWSTRADLAAKAADAEFGHYANCKGRTIGVVTVERVA